MKTRDVAFGGLMVSTVLTIGLVFRGNIRTVQTYLEIIKTIIVALAIRNISPKGRYVFGATCICSCLILLPIQDTLIYNVPSVIGGYVIGIQKNSKKHITNFLVFFFVNTLMIVYEFFVFGFFMQTNLFIEYKGQAARILQQITKGCITENIVMVTFVLFLLADSAFSSFVIFELSQLVLKKVNHR